MLWRLLDGLFWWVGAFTCCLGGLIALLWIAIMVIDLIGVRDANRRRAAEVGNEKGNGR